MPSFEIIALFSILVFALGALRLRKEGFNFSSLEVVIPEDVAKTRRKRTSLGKRLKNTFSKSVTE